ncbi:MAG TPA: PKD domain-containing protein [Acidimicrobiales bacterium]|nr:PKD domain-containing protein [Acidimicrobiales bacterium]
MTGARARWAAVACGLVATVVAPVVVAPVPPAAAAGAGAVRCDVPAAPVTTRLGPLLGVVAPRPVARRRACRAVPGASGEAAVRTARAGAVHEGRYYGGAPPIVDHGGPVMDSAAGVTVVPIYWGAAGAFAASYTGVIDGYLADVAAEDGTATDVFSDDLQYGAPYAVHVAAPVDVTSGLDDGCTPDSGAVYSDHAGYDACVTDAQLQSVVADVEHSDDLPSDLAHVYAVFLPKGVESCEDGRDDAENGACTVSQAGGTFCAYHDNTGAGAVYADLPFPVYDSPTGFTCGNDASFGTEQSPNGQPDADAVIDSLSHELNESITDPYGTAWYDRRGNEIADDCVGFYGLSSGSAGARYNQTIDGAHYLTQEEFSNEDFHAARSTACIQHLDLPTAVVRAPATARAGHSVRFDGGRSKGDITSYAWSFGDHGTGSGRTVSHTFAAAGSYTVRLTTTDVTGRTAAAAAVTLTVR